VRARQNSQAGRLRTPVEVAATAAVEPDVAQGEALPPTDGPIKD